MPYYEEGFIMKKSMNDSGLSMRYWGIAAGEMKKLNMIIFASMVIALSVIINSMFIPVGENLKIKFTFLVLSIGAMIYGPVVGIFAGAVLDTLSYIIMPSGVYFPGYTLSLMLSCLVYGLFFYRSQITVFKIFSAKFIINYFINVGLGSLWSSMLMGKGYIYYFTKSIVKNTLMLPIEVIMLVVLLQLTVPVLVRLGIVTEQKKDRIPLF